MHACDERSNVSSLRACARVRSTCMKCMHLCPARPPACGRACANSLPAPAACCAAPASCHTTAAAAR
jgi:hypothetical protein